MRVAWETPASPGLQTGTEKAHWLSEFIAATWEEKGRASEPTRRGRSRYKFVDPDGLLAEPAYDLGVLMREWSGELLGGDAERLGQERCARLSRLTGVDIRAIWEWGLVERVSTGLLATRVSADRAGKEMLDVAEAWAAP